MTYLHSSMCINDLLEGKKNILLNNVIVFVLSNANGASNSQAGRVG